MPLNLGLKMTLNLGLVKACSEHYLACAQIIQ